MSQFCIWSHNHSTRKKYIYKKCIINKLISNYILLSLNIAYVLIIVQIVFNLTSAIASPTEGSQIREVCGKRQLKEPTGRIFGGTQAKYADWPWMILLCIKIPNRNLYIEECGATLLNKHWAITAAHCVLNQTAPNILMRLGAYDLHDTKELLTYEDLEVETIVRHPEYNRTAKRNDIALLRFKTPVKYRPYIQPVCLPKDNKTYTGETAIATGWGATKHKGKPTAILRQVELPVLSNYNCTKMYHKIGIHRYFPNTNLCAGKEKGTVDACEGDSGGPLVFHNKKDDTYELIGVTSWGVGCGWPNRPGVYTRVTPYKDWINKLIWQY